MSEPTPEATPTPAVPPADVATASSSSAEPAPKPKRSKPTPEEIEERRKLRRLEVIPDGLSRAEWKRQQKKQRWKDTKAEYLEVQREKKRLARQRKRVRLQENEELREAQRKRTKQTPTDVSIIVDCAFDDLMLDGEIVSLSNQIKTCYAAMRRCNYKLPITVTSFNKRLKERFETGLGEYTLWTGNLEFTDKSLMEVGDKLQLVYLTADTDEEITKLEPDHTYVIGGIVDKNRHKKLCYNKAKELGIKVARLPIGKYIEMNGRHVLVTSHVYELLCQWFETGGDWEEAFNKVLPPRKLKRNEESKSATPVAKSTGKEPEEKKD
ncbi:tRNA (guanine(9)-N1)-methyltransferase [Candida viswanathii]|uniref:tRNA (guanine(9)-N1)-methyltransferase n=1 Tax=Candida viswanathii TaxID=5486 RepID=A0A367YLA8_9ASCO|nr:tRNA (guanine(9)-N1)-methyltransferase [Candida viswanathii]